jgi:hypothetical protein
MSIKQLVHILMPFPCPIYFCLPDKYHNTNIRPKVGIAQANVKKAYGINIMIHEN